MLKLVKPEEKYIKSVVEAIPDIEKQTSIYELWAIKNMIKAYKAKDFETYFKNLEKSEKGIDLPENYVKESIFWLIKDEEYIGTLVLRHELNEYLLKIGGNIAYQIKPSEQGKKYAQKGLMLCLQEAKKLGISKALLTCLDTNTASYKVMCNIMTELGGYKDSDINIENSTHLRVWINTEKQIL